MRKIVVIGCPGSGKSTFSRELHKLTQIPLFHLDMMYWNDDKTIVDKNVFLERLSNALESDAWIIDGNYISTMECRIDACDTVIFLDYSVDVCLNGIRSRIGKPRSDMPWTEIEEDAKLVEFVKNYNSQTKPKVLELLNKYHNKNIIIFEDRHKADEFLDNYNGK